MLASNFLKKKEKVCVCAINLQRWRRLWKKARKRSLTSPLLFRCCVERFVTSLLSVGSRVVVPCVSRANKWPIFFLPLVCAWLLNSKKGEYERKTQPSLLLLLFCYCGLCRKTHSGKKLSDIYSPACSLFQPAALATRRRRETKKKNVCSVQFVISFPSICCPPFFHQVRSLWHAICRHLSAIPHGLFIIGFMFVDGSSDSTGC